MTIAIELRGLRKRFTVGAGTCVASADVLRGVDLTVRAAEAVAIVGERGAGKSTLLLCAAGLVTPDRGEIEWFGGRERAVAACRVLYHIARTDLMRGGSMSAPHVHLVDLNEGVHLDAWVRARRDAGDAVVISARATDEVEPLVDRVLVLRRGLLRSFVRPISRVAEAAGYR